MNQIQTCDLGVLALSHLWRYIIKFFLSHYMMFIVATECRIHNNTVVGIE